MRRAFLDRVEQHGVPAEGLGAIHHRLAVVEEQRRLRLRSDCPENAVEEFRLRLQRAEPGGVEDVVEIGPVTS